MTYTIQPRTLPVVKRAQKTKEKEIKEYFADGSFADSNFPEGNFVDSKILDSSFPDGKIMDGSFADDKTADGNIQQLLSICDSLNSLYEKLSRLEYMLKRKNIEITLTKNWKEKNL